MRRQIDTLPIICSLVTEASNKSVPLNHLSLLESSVGAALMFKARNWVFPTKIFIEFKTFPDIRTRNASSMQPKICDQCSFSSQGPSTGNELSSELRLVTP